MATFYLDGTDLTNSTAVYTDEGLTTLAPDQFYSDESGIVREQVNGLLLPSTLCPTCAFPCANLPDFPSGVAGRFPFSINVGGTVSDTGMIEIRFRTGRIPDAIRVTYDGVIYNGLTSSTAGWKQSSNAGSYTFLGSTVDEQGNPETCSVALQNATSTGPYTPTLNNFVLDIPNDEWDPDGTSTQVTILAGDLQFENNSDMSGTPGTWNTMVIPKPNLLPSTIDVEIISDCENTGWQFEIDCPGELDKVDMRIKEVIGANCSLSNSGNSYFYRAGYNGGNGQVGLYDLIYQPSLSTYSASEYSYDVIKVLEVDSNSVVTTLDWDGYCDKYKKSGGSGFNVSLTNLSGGPFLFKHAITYAANEPYTVIVSFKVPTSFPAGFRFQYKDANGGDIITTHFTSSLSGYKSISGGQGEHIYIGDTADQCAADMAATQGTQTLDFVGGRSYSNLTSSIENTTLGKKINYSQNQLDFHTGVANQWYTAVIPLSGNSNGPERLIDYEVVTPCSGGSSQVSWTVDFRAQGSPLPSFSCSSSAYPQPTAADACTRSITSNKYRAGSNNFGSTVLLHDFVYTTAYGSVSYKMDAGWYRINSGVMEVDSNGVVVTLQNCP